MNKIFYTALIGIGIANAAAYKIPEQSLDGMALSAAHVAHSTGADSAYYNPANMAFLDDESSYIEGGLSMVYLPGIDFDGEQYISVRGYIPADAESEKEWAVIPFGHFVSKAMGDWRVGVSITSPAGLTKRWESAVQKGFAEKFYLMSMEINPSVSYKISDTLAVAVGLRAVYSEGEVRSDGSDMGLPFKREMKGNVVTGGYNLALSWKAMPDLEFGATFRSKVDLKEKGEANLYIGNAGRHYSASVTVPMPASLDIAVAKTFNNRLTIEALYERTYWSSYRRLDFEYNKDIQDMLVAIFDKPIDKYWKDSNTWRLGVTYLYSDRLTLMAGYAYDESPIPTKTLGYELPDSDANIFSAGFRYKQDEHLSWGVAVLYDHKDSRSIKKMENEAGIAGRFDKGGAILVSSGFEYKF